LTWRSSESRAALARPVRQALWYSNSPNPVQAGQALKF
jgi:hypothetical protein